MHACRRVHAQQFIFRIEYHRLSYSYINCIKCNCTPDHISISIMSLATLYQNTSHLASSWLMPEIPLLSVSSRLCSITEDIISSSTPCNSTSQVVLYKLTVQSQIKTIPYKPVPCICSDMGHKHTCSNCTSRRSISDSTSEASSPESRRMGLLRVKCVQTAAIYIYVLIINMHGRMPYHNIRI